MRISDWSSDVCSSDLRDDRLARAAEVARRLDQGDEDARWTVSATEQGGYHFERLWRGVTDHHIVEASFIVSAEARKIPGTAADTAYTRPDERRVGKGCVSQCSPRWSPDQ